MEIEDVKALHDYYESPLVPRQKPHFFIWGPPQAADVIYSSHDIKTYPLLQYFNNTFVYG